MAKLMRPSLGNRREDYLAPDGRWRPARPEGVARVLAKAGYGSRQKAEDIVRARRVAVNDELIIDPARAVDITDVVMLDGRPLVEAPRRYYAFHKPQQLDVRTSGGGSDPLFGYLPDDVPGLEPVGRLDARVAGVILVSNDNWWNAAIATKRKLEREFEIRVAGTLGEVELGIVRGGMHLQSLGHIKPVDVRVLAHDEQHTLVRLTVRGGKIRQIRRIFASLRHEVLDLAQVRVGVVKLGTLGVGQVRPLTRGEIRGLELL